MDGTVTGEASASFGEVAPIDGALIDAVPAEAVSIGATPGDSATVDSPTLDGTTVDGVASDGVTVEAVAAENATAEAVTVDAMTVDGARVDGTSTDGGKADAVPLDVSYGGTESGALFDVEMPVRLPSTISPSRAGDFMQCPLLFRLRVVDRIPEPPSAAATRGTLVHAVLDRLFDLPAGGRTPQEAAALLQPEWERLLAKEPELSGLFAEPHELTEWLASAKTLLGKYFTLEDPNRLEPAERELFVRAVVGEGDDRFVLRGIVDRLDIAPNGLLRVVDYKTGKAPPAGYEAKNLFQMKCYALVLWKVRGVVPKRLQLIFLGSGDVLTYDPDERDLLGVERKITAVWAAIRTAAQRREWPASPSRLCDWCSFKPRCPAHGGELPLAPQVEFLPAVKEPEAV